MKVKAILLLLIMLSLCGINGVIDAEDKESYLDVFTPQNSDLGTWAYGWANEPDEISAQVVNGEAVITGDREDQSFGCIHKKLIVDFERYSYLEIEVTKVTDSWYIIFSSPEFENGFVRIQSDTKKTGKFRYNLWDYPQLKGQAEFDIQIGVSAPNKKGQKGAQVVFKNMRFVDVGAKRPPRGPKLTKHDLPSPIPISKAERPQPVISKIAPLPSKAKEAEPVPYALKKNIFEVFAREESPVNLTSSAPVFDETDKDAISIENDCYKIVFSKRNGAILGIEDKLNKEAVSSGSVGGELWRLNFYKRKSITNKDFSAGSEERPFEYKWQKSKGELSFLYQDKTAGFQLKIKTLASKKNYFDFQVEIESAYEEPIILVNFPEGLSFRLEKLRQVIFPFRGGLALKPGFFLERRYITESQYLFSDYLAVEFDKSGLSLYTIQEPGRWTEPTMSVGYDSYKGGVGFYTFAQATYIKKTKQKAASNWKSPVIRLRVAEPVKESIRNYVEDNGFDDIPNLAKRIDRGLFDKLSKSVLLKFDFSWIGQKFSEVSEFIKTLPSPTLVHIVTFWDKGFDKNYPDYLPPNKQFGTQEDLKELVATAHGEGHLVMPYTNPTWWNESKTLETLGKEKIAVIKLDGQVHDEYYWGKNWGIITSPHNPEVIKRTQQTVREFKYDIPCDILFEDQLGARPWQYDLNPKARDPALYKQGLIDFAKRDSKQIPVMCEGGYDGLMPYVVAFSDMAVNNSLPPDKIFNTWYGEGNWETFPYALYVAHNKNGFYQHNLAHEVFTDAKGKLMWNVAYGHNFTQGYWPKEWEKNQKKWFYIDDAFQKSLASRYFGKKLTDFQRIDGAVTFSRFEDIAIVANHSKSKPYRIESYIVPPEGFLAESEGGNLVAGMFKVFNDSLLAGEHYIIVENSPNKIVVRQPDPKSTLISINRPSDWKEASGINISCAGQPVPAAVTEDKITFLYDNEELDGEYLIEYTPAKEDIELSIQPEKRYAGLRENLKVNITARNLSGDSVKEGKLALSVWLVHAAGPVPDMWAGYLGESVNAIQMSEAFYSLDAGSQVAADFTVTLPEKIKDGDVVWLKGEIIYGQDSTRKMKQAQTKVDIIPQPVEIQVEPEEVIIYPEVKKQIDIRIRNKQAESLKGEINLETDLPKGTVGKEKIPFSLEPMEEKNIFVNLLILNSGVGKDYKLTARVRSNNTDYSSGVCSVKAREATPDIDLGPQNILVLGKKRPLYVGIKAHRETPLNGWLTIEAPNGWEITPQKRLLELVPGEYKKFDFTIMPTSKADADIAAVITTAGGAVIKAKEPFKVIGEDREAALIESDINQDGHMDFVLANALIEIQATEAIGGRILSFFGKETGSDELYSAYSKLPKGKQAQDWVEYGGINDWFPEGWPGEVWGNNWQYEVKEKGPDEASVRMWTETQNKLYIERIVVLRPGAPYLELKYKIKNNSDKEQKFVWANHPDLACGPSDATEDNQIVIPTKGKGLVIQDYGKSMSKTEYAVGENWILGYDKASNEYFMQEFDKDLVDKVGVWEGIGFYTMELIFKPRTLKPQEEFDFEIKYSAGKEDLQSLIKR